jgi:hypothetical protein
MTTDTESMRALAAEARETVVLTEQFYSCVVKDPRTGSGEYRAVRPGPLPNIDALRALMAESEKVPEVKTGSR